MLTARAECYLVGHPDALRESVRPLQAYAEAGGDVLFAPGLHEPAEIKALVEAVRPNPFNLLVVRDSGLSVADIAALGVRRISVGPALALAAWTGFTRAPRVSKSEGSFAGLAQLVPYPEIKRVAERDCYSAAWLQPRPVRLRFPWNQFTSIRATIALEGQQRPRRGTLGVCERGPLWGRPSREDLDQ